MIFRASAEQQNSAWQKLVKLIASHNEGLPSELVQIIAGITGLLACVAAADGEFSEEERAHLRKELGRIRAFSKQAIDATLDSLSKQLKEIANTAQHHCARALYELTDREQRLEVLEVLIDTAASDNELETSETNLLRRITEQLGLSQDEYTAIQSKHRDKLSILKP
ncbi:MAG: TerB family tellurite resistance protein [Myxococcales bacterium]|nr:MAG: TerB family tellurite resistance protein [Myxococcales bacterium]